jgi:hypothetical protein
MLIFPPNPNEYAPFYEGYVSLVKHHNAGYALEESLHDMLHFLQTLPANKNNYRYAPDKWSINEVIQHVIDSEIIFLYRALRIARGDQTPLPGYDQDAYVLSSQADYQSIEQLSTLMKQTRQLTIALFSALPPQSLENTGTANNFSVSCRSLCYIISGHMIHHLNILKTRYS